MFQIEENDEELIIKEFPVWNWFFYGLISISLINTFYWFVSNLVGIDISSIVKAFFIISFSGIFVYIYFPITKIYLNQRKQLLTVSKENLLKKEFKIYSFSEIKDEILVKEKKLEIEKIYS